MNSLTLILVLYIISIIIIIDNVSLRYAKIGINSSY